MVKTDIYHLSVSNEMMGSIHAVRQRLYRRKLIRLKEKLEELTGNKISDEKLKESIGKTNKIRSLLNEISELKKGHPPSIGGYDFIRLNHYSFYCDRDIMITKLEDLHKELKQAGKSFPKKRLEYC